MIFPDKIFIHIIAYSNINEGKILLEQIQDERLIQCVPLIWNKSRYNLSNILEYFISIHNTMISYEIFKFILSQKKKKGNQVCTIRNVCNISRRYNFETFEIHINKLYLREILRIEENKKIFNTDHNNMDDIIGNDMNNNGYSSSCGNVLIRL